MPSHLRIPHGPVTFTPPYFHEYVFGHKDAIAGKCKLPEDKGAHALFYYNLLAYKNLQEAKENLVYEDEPSRFFPLEKARKLLESIAVMYAVTPGEMVRYWDAVIAQRRALGFSENADLPHRYRFRFN